MSAPNDTLVPIPARYWWLKRILLGVAVLIVALGGLRWWWGVEADRHWRACLAGLEASGEPLHARDFAVPAIPDEENAAYFLKAAVAAIKPVPYGLFEQLAESLDLPGRDQDVAQALAENAESLRLLRQARSASGVDWQIASTAGLRAWEVHAPSQLQLAHLADLAARTAYDRGDAPAAIEFVRDLMHQARASRARRDLLGHLTGIRADELAARLVELIVQDVTASPSPGMKKEEIKELAASFLDESDVWTSWRWAWLEQRAGALEDVKRITEKGSNLGGVRAWPMVAVLAPALKTDAARVMRWTDQTVRMAEARDAVVAHARYPAVPDFKQKLNRYARLLSAFLLPDYSSVLDDHFKAIALRRLVAARLGIALYVTDHGDRPPTLAELVPAYLPAVPLDPLFDDGRTIEYVPRGVDEGLYAGRPRDPVAMRLYSPVSE